MDKTQEKDGPPPVVGLVAWIDRPIATLSPFNMQTVAADITVLLMKKESH